MNNLFDVFLTVGVILGCVLIWLKLFIIFGSFFGSFIRKISVYINKQIRDS